MGCGMWPVVESQWRSSRYGLCRLCFTRIPGECHGLPGSALPRVSCLQGAGAQGAPAGAALGSSGT